MPSISQRVNETLQGIPFDNLIGGPLNACVRAQGDAAQTTLNFINSVGLTTNEDGTKSAIYVQFQFIQNGRKVTMSVPLLAIVPIPYICINTIDINFKCKVEGVERSEFTDSFSYENKSEKTEDKKTNLWIYKKTSNLKTSVSTKRDSVSTRNSTFSVESTIDVAVHASQDSMPAGLAKVLELIGNSIDVVDPDGELEVNATLLYTEKAGGKARVVARYRNPDGLYEEVKAGDQKGNYSKIDGYSIFELPKGSYDIIGGKQKISVEVKDPVTEGTTANNNNQKNK